MRKLLCVFLGLLWTLLHCPLSAQAAVTYSLAFDQQNYVVQAGESFEVELFLFETFDGDATTGTTRFGGAAGMIAGSVRSVLSGGGSTIFSADPLFGVGFDDPLNFADHTSSVAQMNQLIDLFSPRVGGTVSGNVTQVSLGRFFLTAGSVGSVNQLTASDLSPFDDLGIEDEDFNLFVIDTDPSFGSTPSTITAVPEPGTCAALLVLSGAAVARNRYLKRRQKVALD